MSGPDSFTFLQGQFTQDLRLARSRRKSAYGLWLTHKGKVLADGHAVALEDDKWLLISVMCGSSDLRKRLEAYVIADDVLIQDVTEQWRGIALLGGGASDLLNKVGWSLGDEQSCHSGPAGVVFRGRRAAEENWEWLYRAENDPLPMLADAAGDGLEKLEEAELERLRIEAALPSIPRDIGPEDLPNEGGLELDAISYTKGCYLGQEVMARLKSMGQVRRRLVRVSGRCAPPAGLPAMLYTEEGRQIGELRSAVATENGFIGLAIISLLASRGLRVLSLAPDKPADVDLTEPTQ